MQNAKCKIKSVKCELQNMKYFIKHKLNVGGRGELRSPEYLMLNA